MSEPDERTAPVELRSTPETNEGSDLADDVSRFGEPLVFDRHGNLVSGKKPKPPDSAAPAA